MQVKTSSREPSARASYLAPRDTDNEVLRHARDYVLGFRHDPLRAIRHFDVTRDRGLPEVQAFEKELLSKCTIRDSESNVRIRYVDCPSCDLNPVVAVLRDRTDAYKIKEYAVRCRRVAELYEFLRNLDTESVPESYFVTEAVRAVSTRRPLHRCTLCNGPWVDGVSVAMDLGHARPYNEEHVFHLTCALYLRTVKFPCCPCPAAPHRAAMCLSVFKP